MASLKLGLIDASVVSESVVRVAVRECAACAGLHARGHAVCHFEGGLLAGAVESIFRHPVRVHETACIGGHGSDACRFEIEFKYGAASQAARAVTDLQQRSRTVLPER